MSKPEPISYFRQRVVTLAREMSISDARCFLLGLLQVTEGEPALDPVRETYELLCRADDQLVLLADTQLQLPLVPHVEEEPKP